MAEPFLAIADFENEFGRDLTGAEELTATRLLQVVSDWIREKSPLELADDDLRARQVVFEVVRDAAKYGDLERVSQYTNTTNTRTEAVTLDEAMKVVDDYLTDRHKRLLGIPVSGGPVGSFPKCDY